MEAGNLIPDLTGSSNAVFSLALSLVSGNVGGNTKKMIASAVIFVGVAVGNIAGPYAFIARGESSQRELFGADRQKRRFTRPESSSA